MFYFFLKLNLNQHSKYSEAMPTQEEKYIEQLSDVEKKILKIAQDHLETSFNVRRSIGFKEWISTQEEAPA